jgi:hypothetical protein
VRKCGFGYLFLNASKARRDGAVSLAEAITSSRVINKAAPQVFIQEMSVPIKLALSWWLLLVALAFMAERVAQLMPRLANLLPV